MHKISLMYRKPEAMMYDVRPSKDTLWLDKEGFCMDTKSDMAYEDCFDQPQLQETLTSAMRERLKRGIKRGYIY